MLADLAAAALRTLDPETAHRLAIRGLAMGLGPSRRAPAWPRLSTSIAGLALPNPLGLAAGFDKNAEAITGLQRAGFGFVEVGTVTPKPQAGNPRPRLFRLVEDDAVINRMGFNNDGLAPFVDRLRRRVRGGVVGANIGANKDSVDRIADYITGLTHVHPHADYITINVSSPNTPGLRGLQDKAALDELLHQVQACRASLASPRRPVFLKVAPDLDETAIDDIAGLAVGRGLDGLIISNTTIARPDSLASRYKSETGGLSGAPVFAASTRILGLFAARLAGQSGPQFCLIGVGGVRDGESALAKIKAGASALQLYSALALQGPGVLARILTDLDARLRAEGFAALSQAVGVAVRS
jgi:dihydroorotate dehydrogenase